MELLSAIALIAIAAGTIYGAYWLFITVPTDMATERDRDPTSWVVVAVFCSPFAAIFLLWLLGPAPKRYR